MASFIKLEDSPMFRKQVHTLELTTDELKDRCQRLHKGCKKYMAALGGACDADLAFADCLEAFGGGFDDPVSVSIGGPVFAKFITAFRELGTYKDHLRSQVDHMLSESLTQFMSVDLNDAKTNESMYKNLSSVVWYDKQRKRGIRPSLLPMLSDEGGSFWMISGSECRRRFDKATNVYDQAREKFTSLKKGTRADIVAELEEDLQNSRSTFEKCRFNLVNALTNIEAKKKYEFLESFSAIMDAHLKYFKLGYELFSNMEPFIHQVLTYAQQSKEMADVEQDKLAKRIQEFRTQAELNNQRVSSDVEASPRCEGIQVFGSSYKDIEALMQSTADGEVLTIKEGYLLKRSSSLRADWKRRFFVLDSRGTLYYYRDTGTKPVGPQSHQSTGTSEHGSGVFGRFRRYRRALSMTEESLGCRTVNLRMSTIKIDAEHSDLRLCFRIISPMKTYTLQAETEADRMDWVDKIRGVITSLLNSPFVEQFPSGQEGADSKGFVDSVGGESALQDVHVSSEDEMKSRRQDCVSNILREIRGNDLCAECSAPEPDWSSLNLGILLCIECSGVHRNLGVHISKVRSITLDVKVWEPTILDLFRNLGNAYCNSVWEEVLQLQNEREDESGALFSSTKPKPRDAILRKERFIQSKYVEKKFIIKETIGPGVPSHVARIWEAVKSNNLQAVYRLIVASDVNVNTCYDEVKASDLHHLVNSPDLQSDCSDTAETMQYDPAACQRIKNSGEQPSCLQGCSLLHLACHVGDLVMLELLLQFGADINMCDFHGRTPLHHCISIGKNTFAKYLLKRGARSSIKDGGGQTALERAMEMGAITDEKLFILLTK